MSSIILDPQTPRFHGSFDELPRGLVRPPQEILDQVAQDQEHSQPFYTDEYAKRILDDWTLAYYFDGINVAYRSVPEGVEVLAVGDEEIGALVQQIPPEARPDVKTKIP